MCSDAPESIIQGLEWLWADSAQESLPVCATVPVGILRDELNFRNLRRLSVFSSVHGDGSTLLAIGIGRSPNLPALP